MTALVKCRACPRYFRPEDGYGEGQRACSEDCAGPCACSIGGEGRPNPGTMDGNVVCPVHGPWAEVAMS